MVDLDRIKKIISKIYPLVEKVPDIVAKLSELEKDPGFQDAVGKLGTVGGLFSIGLYIFNKAIENNSDSETTYYSLIGKTAIRVTKEIIKEAAELNEDEQKNEEILKQMMKIYLFKETDKEKYHWNGIPIDHPIVKEFRKIMVQIIRENKLENRYKNFVTDFNIMFKDKMQHDVHFIECQKQATLRNLSKERSDYLKWIINDLDRPHPIDKKKATDYFIQNRAIEFVVEEESYQTKDYWNLSDSEAEIYFEPSRKWKVEYFLLSIESVKYIAAPFGTGKTSFAKHTAIEIVNKYLTGSDTWIPIYLPLKQKLGSEYRPNHTIYQDIIDIIQPEYEKILLICDGLDEYPDPNGITSLKEELLDLRSKFSISHLKIIFTTRLEAGFPQTFGIKRFVRLMPFTPDQVTEFFKKYFEKEDHLKPTFASIGKYELQKEKNNYHYKIDLLKPLFCWMFAISHEKIEEIQNMDINISRFILYSTFIHHILEGKYKYSKEIAKEKWILRKIAVLKTIFDEIYEEDLPRKLEPFIKDEKFIDLQYKKLHPVLTSYFKLNVKSDGRHSIDFLHKSFQEYLLAEYYVESILYDKGFRLNIGHPSDVTIEFLSSFLSIIKDNYKKEYEQPLLRIARSFYLNKADLQDEEVSPLIKNLKDCLLDNAIEIFDENKLVYIDIEKNTIESEYWMKKDISSYKKHYENFIYKAISLFIIKKLNPRRNPASLIDFIKDSHNISPTLKYFPFAGLTKASLIRADLTRADLKHANLTRADLTRADLKHANLTGAHITRAYLIGAELTETHLTGAHITRAYLTGAYLTDADLTDADFTETHLTRADLSGAILRKTNLTRADLSGAILLKTNLIQVNLSGAVLTRADFRGAILQEAIILEPQNFSDIIVDGNTDFQASITDNQELYSILLEFKIKNPPILVENKEKLIEELNKIFDNNEQIKRYVNLSKFS